MIYVFSWRFLNWCRSFFWGLEHVLVTLRARLAPQNIDTHILNIGRRSTKQTEQDETKQRKRNRRKQSGTEWTLFDAGVGCFTHAPRYFHLCSKHAVQCFVLVFYFVQGWAASHMFPVTSIFASNMQCNALCFPVHTLGRSNGWRQCRRPPSF